MDKKTFRYEILFTFFALIFICSCNKVNNKVDESKITQIEIVEILASHITLDEKYKKIFIDKDFYNSDLQNKEITKTGHYFGEGIKSRWWNIAEGNVIIDDNNMLQLKVDGAVKLKFNKSFDKYWLKVSTFVQFEKKSFLSDTMVYELSDINDNTVSFSVLVPIDNRLSTILRKEKYIHLDSEYLKHTPKTTSYTVTLRASNIIGDEYEIPLLFSDFKVQWNNAKSYTNKLSIEKKEIAAEENNVEITKRIQFLLCTNAGYTAYFDDGTISGCARCECPKGDYINVPDLDFAKYKILPNGNLELEDGTIEIPVMPKQDDYDGWVIINYKHVL